MTAPSPPCHLDETLAPSTRHTFDAYLALGAIEDRWQQLADVYGGRTSCAGTSVEGRAIPRIEFGDPKAPSVLFTSLMHGIELVGGLALFELAKRLVKTNLNARFVFLPVVNPDAVSSNLERLRAGRLAYQRCNANGVDLNRNFAPIERRRLWHPFAGSRHRWSPHYMGPAPWSEPETQAVAETALDVRPKVALGFHSFGNLLLFPWAFTEDRHPEAASYERLGAAFCDGGEPYRLQQACAFYPTLGDMDDWLDHAVGTRAFTVEVGRGPRNIRNLLHLLNPFYWMNPIRHVERIVDDVVTKSAALVRLALTGAGRDRSTRSARAAAS